MGFDGGTLRFSPILSVIFFAFSRDPGFDSPRRNDRKIQSVIFRLSEPFPCQDKGNRKNLDFTVKL